LRQGVTPVLSQLILVKFQQCKATIKTYTQPTDEVKFYEFQAYKILYALLSAGLIEHSPAEVGEENTGVEHDYPAAIKEKNFIINEVQKIIRSTAKQQNGKQSK